jgi:hypothetical protein
LKKNKYFEGTDTLDIVSIKTAFSALNPICVSHKKWNQRDSYITQWVPLFRSGCFIQNNLVLGCRFKGSLILPVIITLISLFLWHTVEAKEKKCQPIDLNQRYWMDIAKVQMLSIWISGDWHCILGILTTRDARKMRVTNARGTSLICCRSAPIRISSRKINMITLKWATRRAGTSALLRMEQSDLLGKWASRYSAANEQLI